MARIQTCGIEDRLIKYLAIKDKNTPWDRERILDCLAMLMWDWEHPDCITYSKVTIWKLTAFISFDTTVF